MSWGFQGVSSGFTLKPNKGSGEIPSDSPLNILTKPIGVGTIIQAILLDKQEGIDLKVQLFRERYQRSFKVIGRVTKDIPGRIKVLP